MAVTPITVKRELYADFHKDFTENPVNFDLARKINEEAVKESIRNLILTDRGERPFQPKLGSNIRAVLFDTVTPAITETVREMISDTIRNYEPRANLISVDVSGDVDTNSIKATIIFNVINSEEPITLEATLNRVR